MPSLSVTVKQNGFRRAGRTWSGTTVIDTADFTEEQLLALADDPMFELDYAESETVEPDPLIDQLVDAISKLDPFYAEHYTQGKNKKPQLKALQELTGVSVTAQQRDAAFEIFTQSVNQ